ncbi:hypothetical protein [Pseudactinotalea sp. HY158]|uniref:hypothetical protein n=1 Tax=Pseudactinotalea sp. HY158 TaxID=2654547 RepID=UPI00129D0786|nr:hypothetical protein [Pseudactinotalea sp. HY158]QGH69039.1 hypothetical protein GCE65_05630 [Pseudactinotalea sp. HY158]
MSPHPRRQLSRHRLLDDLRVGLADIAEVAGVQRPVVSVWRSRHPDGPNRFPLPCEQRGTRLLFRAGEVADWIDRTGLGNNREFTADVVVRALRGSVAPAELHVITALVRLRAASGGPLAGCDVEALLDLADDADPHDRDSYRELEAAAAVPARLEHLASLADEVVDSAYSAGAAIDRLLPALVPADDALAPAALDLLARLALTLSPGGPLVVADPEPGAGDVLAAVLSHEEHLDRARAVLPEPAGAPPTIDHPPGDRPADDRPTTDHPTTARSGPGAGTLARLARRRLLAHGWQVTHSDMASGFAAGAIVVTTLSRWVERGERGERGDAGVLERIDEIAVRLAPGQRAVVLGPARVLIDEAGPEVESIRSDLLRTDKVRAAVLLPAGLVPSRSRERLALWVLGDAHPEVPIGGRWIMVADASVQPLRRGRLPAGLVDDLLTDVLAAMGTSAEVRAHAFRFARFAHTSRILAERAGLLATSRPLQRAIRDDAAAPARVRELSRALADVPAATVDLAVRAGDPVAVRRFTLGELIDRRALRRLPGNRIEGLARPATGASGEVRVIGPAEVTGEGGPRAVDRMELIARHPGSRLTEPGDVVFTSAPRPAAIVDRAGLSLVAYPAQVLRVRDHAVGLVPALIAADIRRAERGTRRRDWALRLVPPEQAAQTAAALARIEEAQAAARESLRLLQELTTEVTAGVSAGVVRLVDDESDHPEQE